MLISNIRNKMAAPIATDIWKSFLINLSTFIVVIYAFVYANNSVDNDIITDKEKSNFYEFSVRNANGEIVSLKKYRGMVTLAVNVASECGFTDGHYKSLIRLKNVLAASGKFEILAFPCNQFGQQEQKTDAEIQAFVEETYHVNFPVFSKIDVFGKNVSECWKYLSDSFGEIPNWNFWKYLIDEDGKVVNAWGPWISVEDIFNDVKQALHNVHYPKPSESMHTQDRAQNEEL